MVLLSSRFRRILSVNPRVLLSSLRITMAQSAEPFETSKRESYPGAGSTTYEPIKTQQDLLVEQPSLAAQLFGWMWPTSEKLAYQAESALLKNVRASFKQRLVSIGNNNYINTVELGSHATATSESPARTVVLLHGYGAGLAMYYKNLDVLASEPGLKTYALDWLGMGRSSRPNFPFWPDKPNSIEGSEAFFIESLEEWRKTQNIDHFILVGHSLGGYLSAAYALKYPEHVKHLILVSPVGLPEKPEEIAEAYRTGKISWGYRTIETLWNASISPFMLVRGLGYFGPSLINGYATRRFQHINPDEVERIRDYIYHINAKRGSGEFAVHTILSMGAYARKPLVHRLPLLQMPTTFLYGLHDWMNVEHAHEIAPRMPAGATVHTISDAGHFLFLENASLFNKLFMSAIRRSPL